MFHASEDRQAVRDGVFQVLGGHEVRVDVTLLDKPKTQSRLRESHPRFYQNAWFYHLRYVLPRVCRRSDMLHVVVSDIRTKAKRVAFRDALEDVMRQCCPPGVRCEVRFWVHSAEIVDRPALRDGKGGSHQIWRCGKCQTVVPLHTGDIPTGTLRSIERDLEACLGPK